MGRNDPCSCGSGKKYKQCCLLKKVGAGGKRKITAKWLNPGSAPVVDAVQKDPEINLMERTFGRAITENTFEPVPPKQHFKATIPENDKKIDL